MLSVSRPFNIDDRMINVCGAVGGMRSCRGTEVLGENPPQYHFVHHKFHMT
jgi:hypothetical protein